MKSFYQDIEIFLFDGISPSDRQDILRAINAKEVNYSKDSILLQRGDQVKAIGVVLSGTVHILAEGDNGKNSIISVVESGDVFCETLVCAGVTISPITVVSVTECSVLYIEYNRLFDRTVMPYEPHCQMICNMMKIISVKNLLLTKKLVYLSKHTIRERLTAYFADEAKKAGSTRFVIEFNREEMADYLCVERSALSKELSKMRDEGLIRYHRNQFELL